jgi:hypothetical protein
VFESTQERASAGRPVGERRTPPTRCLHATPCAHLCPHARLPPLPLHAPQPPDPPAYPALVRRSHLATNLGASPLGAALGGPGKREEVEPRSAPVR